MLLRFEHLSVDDGLSHGSVYTVTQDLDGFLWIGTEDGLNRWDGRSFQVFRHRPADPNSLASSNFGKILVDPDGSLWLGTWGSGLDHYDPREGRFTHFRHDPDNPESLAQDRVEFLFIDAEERLWVGTQERGVSLFDRETGKFRTFYGEESGIRHGEVKAICQLDDGRLMIGGNSGMDVWDADADRFVPFLHEPTVASHAASGDVEPTPCTHRIRSCLQDRNGDLWIGTRGEGLIRRSAEGELLHHYLPDPDVPESLQDDSISALLEDSFGRLWIGTYLGGLSLLQEGATRSEDGFLTARYDPRFPESLQNDRVETLFEDDGGVLWIGTRGTGLGKLDLKPRKFYDHIYAPVRTGSLPHPTVRTIVAESGAATPSIWVGTDGGGPALCGFSPGSCRVFPASRIPFLRSDRVVSLMKDHAGHLWIGSYERGMGIGRIDPQSGEISEGTHYGPDPDDPASLPSGKTHVFLEDHRGEFWIGTDVGLVRATGPVDDLRFERYPHGRVDGSEADARRLSHPYIITLLEGPHNELWIGTRRGLNRLDAERENVRRFLAEAADEDARSGSRLLNDNIISLWLDQTDSNRLWVGTEGGGLHLLDLETESFRALRVDDGLPSDMISGILQDSTGDLWLSTGRGLSRFNPRDETFRNYFAGAGGLRHHSYMRSSSLRLEDGTLFFGGITGMTAFRPREIYDNPHRPPLVLTDIKIFGGSLDLDRPLIDLEEVSVDEEENFLTLEFAALDFTAPLQNSYRYRLEGVDKDWVEAGSRNFATYTNLDPGSYLFTAEAANNDGIWTEEALQLRITVVPPIWKTSWFRAAALGFFLLLLLAGHKMRVRFIHRRNADLERINEERRHWIEELEKKNAEIQHFTYSVSHDLKSPLVTVRGFLGMLEMDLRKGNEERVKTDIEHLRLAVDQMQFLLDDLLELSRIGKITSSISEFSFDAVAREAMEIVGGQILERDAEVVVHPTEQTIVGDRRRLVQLLQNLIDNAVKFVAPETRPRIEIGCRGPAEDPEQMVFYVADNGVGIAPEYQAKVFQVFERLQTDQKGSGIGLAVVKRIVVDVHDGRVWAESEGEGHGTTFYFTLPTAPDSPDSTPPDPASSAPA